jgi:uncharacterized protein (UPF0276 family)
VIPVGLSLHPEEEFLDRLDEVIRCEVDYFEVAPETLWREDGEGALHDNGYFRRFLALREAGARSFVAHGVGFSPGSASRADVPRRRRWLSRMARDHAAFGFLWYTDHLGASAPAGLAATLPLPVPMDAHAARVLRRSLDAMAKVVPDVGLENTVAYFVIGDPLDEPAFLGRVLRAPRRHLLLDLHNVYTMAQNFGFEPEAYLERLDLDRVIEIHLSGGSSSDPAWLPSGRVLRLDGHDDAVPEAVWQLFDRVAPRCRRLRGVTLERMEGTVTSRQHVAEVRGEIRRARRALGRLG